MAPAILTSIGHARKAFSRLPQPDDRKVVEALELLRATEGDNTGMGFHSLSRSILDIKRLLNELGLTLDEAQLEKLTNSIAAIEEQKRARLRTLMQILISVAILVVAFVMLAFGDPSAVQADGLFGLLGCVVGYWLR